MAYFLNRGYTSRIKRCEHNVNHNSNQMDSLQKREDSHSATIRTLQEEIEHLKTENNHLRTDVNHIKQTRPHDYSHGFDEMYKPVVGLHGKLGENNKSVQGYYGNHNETNESVVVPQNFGRRPEYAPYFDEQNPPSFYKEPPLTDRGDYDSPRLPRVRVETHPRDPLSDMGYYRGEAKVDTQPPLTDRGPLKGQDNMDMHPQLTERGPLRGQAKRDYDRIEMHPGNFKPYSSNNNLPPHKMVRLQCCTYIYT